MEQIYVIMYNIMVDQLSMFRAIDFSAPQSVANSHQHQLKSICTSIQSTSGSKLSGTNHALNVKTIHIVLYGKFSVFSNILPMSFAYRSTFLDREFQPRNHSESPYFQATSITHFGHFLCGRA